jgi:hypothetical protein
LLRLPPAVLASNTLDTLLHSVYGKEVAESFIVQFPYWAEMRTLRADVALDAFLEGPLGQGAERRESAERKGTEGAERREGPQGPESHGWGGCAEGLSALTDRMGEDIIQRGGTIRLRTSLVEVRPHVRGVEVRIHEKDQKEEEWLACKKLVVALDADSLRHVKGLGSNLPVLRHLKAEPLLRVYAIFPTEKQKPWFAGMAKVVVSTPIRFFIPMDEAKGVAMISYTEGRDAEHWMRIKDKGDRERALMRELRRTFPEKEIPDPLAIFFYGWEQGCTYWLPSKSTASASLYSVEEASAHSVQPFPRVPLYLCGESFAVQQSWMESALIQAERVLRAL